MTIKYISKHPLYKTWVGMKQRCYNQNSKSYKNYGGRGIRVCPDWLISFPTFVDDMGEKPSPQHSIDRIDNNKGYTPENCRWATRVEQARNTSRNHYLFYKGQDTLLIDVARDIGITQQALQGRLQEMTLDDALHLPANPDRKRYIKANGRCLTLDSWAKELGLSRSAIERRLTTMTANRALSHDTKPRQDAAAKRGVEQLTKEGEHIQYFCSLSEAGRITGINFKNIQTVCKGLRHKAGGFKWSYA